MRELVVAGVLMLFAPHARAQSAPSAAATAVMRAEQQWNDAWRTRDLNVGVNDDGLFVSKPDHVKNFTDPSGEVFSVLRVHQMQVRVYGDIAGNSGELHMELTHDGHPAGGDFLFTDVWRRRHGVWQVVASAETPTQAQQAKDKGKPKLVGAEAFSKSTVGHRSGTAPGHRHFVIYRRRDFGGSTRTANHCVSWRKHR